MSVAALYSNELYNGEQFAIVKCVTVGLQQTSATSTIGPGS